MLSLSYKERVRVRNRRQLCSVRCTASQHCCHHIQLFRKCLSEFNVIPSRSLFIILNFVLSVKHILVTCKKHPSLFSVGSSMYSDFIAFSSTLVCLLLALLGLLVTL